MDRWSSRQYRKHAIDAGVDAAVLEHALAIGSEIVRRNRNVQPVFTLKHLAVSSGVEYSLLRHFVRGEKEYTSFPVHKRPGPDGKRRYRIICVPSPALMKVQRWIAQNILAHATPHEASVAFAPNDTLYKAVEPHCGSRWLIKLDIRNFFESISEISAYQVFLGLGFQPLISFEMARICTRVHPGIAYGRHRKFFYDPFSEYTITDYRKAQPGHLPQGAPTSPMLANLACIELDERLTEIADSIGLQYTRYADDMTFSTSDRSFTRENAGAVIGSVYQALACHGLMPNRSKTSVIPPGARKVVLGLLVDGSEPRLQREFKALLRQHIYYLLREDVGPVKHARARGFTSVVGLRNHLQGLLSFAGQIEPDYAVRQWAMFNRIHWPI